MAKAQHFHDFPLTERAAEGPWKTLSSASLQVVFAADRLVASVQAETPPGGPWALKLQARTSRNHTRWSPWMELASWSGPEAPETPKSLAGALRSPQANVNEDHLVALQGGLFRFVQVRIAFTEGVVPRNVVASARVDAWKPASGKDWPPLAFPRDPAGLPAPLCQFDVKEIGERICSPASVAWAIQALKGSEGSPAAEEVARLAYDPERDIYGNWPRAAFAAGVFGAACELRFFANFGEALELLDSGAILAASVRYARGELPGAAQPQTQGHLIAVWGWDAGEREVLCFDPAQPADAPFPHRYPAEPFLKAWLGNKGLAYALRS